MATTRREFLKGVAATLAAGSIPAVADSAENPAPAQASSSDMLTAYRNVVETTDRPDATFTMHRTSKSHLAMAEFDHQMQKTIKALKRDVDTAIGRDLEKALFG